MKYTFLIIILLFAFNFKGQITSVNNKCDLRINGSWILSHISDIYPYVSCKQDILKDSIIKLVINNDSIAIYKKMSRFWKDTSYFSYKMKDDCLITLIKDSHLKKKKQKTVNFEVLKNTNSELIIQHNSFDYYSSFINVSTKRYYYSKVQDYKNIITENNFLGKWFLKENNSHNVFENDTIVLTRDSCSYKIKNNNYIQYLELSDTSDFNNTFYFEEICLDCFFHSGVYIAIERTWKIDISKNLIIFLFDAKREFNYHFNKNELLLIKK